MRTLDAMVAERVMGWVWWDNSKGDWKGDDGVTFWAFWDDRLSVYQNGSEYPTLYFSPSTDIAAAWAVVSKLYEQKYTARIYQGATCVIASFAHFDMLGDHEQTTEADTVPLAICIAALRAVGVTQNEIDAAMKQEVSA